METVEEAGKATAAQPEMRRARPFAKGVAALVTVLVLGEIFVRVFVGGPSPQSYDPDIGYRYLPGATLFQAKEGFTRLQFNSLGLNDAPIDVAGTRCRVMVVGDSYTAALQVPRERNFTSVAERLDQRLDVVNAGRDGLFLGDLHKVAARFTPEVKPDLVVFVVSERAIDTDTHLPGLRVATEPQTGRIVDVQMQVEQQEGLKRIFGPLLNRSALATRLSAQFKPMVVDLIAQVTSWRHVLQDDVVNAETRAVAAGPAHTDEQLLAYLFDRFQRDGPAALLYVNGLVYAPDRTAAVAQSSAEAEAVAVRAAAQVGIPFRDTGDQLIASFARTGKPPFGFANALLPGGHLNEVGHEAVGMALVDLVTSMEPRLPARCSATP